MGMAASQARLLCITARIHDVEFAAQTIQNAKLQLATQSDQVYRDYLEALDATTLTIRALDPNSGASSTVTANFNNLFSRNRVTPAALGANKSYALRCHDPKYNGFLIVEDEIEEAYYSGNFNNAYQFALHMMNQDDGALQAITNGDDFEEIVQNAEENFYQSLNENEKSSSLSSLREKLEEFTSGGDGIYDSNSVSEENQKDYEDTLNAYRQALYKNNAGKINEMMYTADGEEPPVEAGDFDLELFNYYVGIYNQIEMYGGCVSIDEYDGMNGDASNDSEWLQSMIQSGHFTIDIVTVDPKTGKVTSDATSPSSDTNLNYTATTEIDKRAAAKAEAEYEHKLKQIDKKDKQYDLELSKLETERKALTTEYDQVKTVIQDNIDRTFKIFS